MTKSKRLLVDIKGKNWPSATLALSIGLYCLWATSTVQAGGGAHASIPGPFTTSAEANQQCITCHETQANDLRKSIHWSWERERVIGDQATRSQKGTDLTRFGLEAAANPTACRRCHISILPQEQPVSQAPLTGINCLICHDTTGTYQPEVQGTELEKIVRTVGEPSARNCQSCHDQQCGLTPDPDKIITADVHLQRHGFTCQRCHPGNGHHEFKRTLAKTTGLAKTEGCASCHTQAPHLLARLNQHATLIGCQSCHIPEYGNNSPAVISWNWLLSDSQETIYQEGNILLTDQGFTLGQNVTPLYFWDNGAEKVYTRGERIQPEQTTLLQGPGPRTPASKIMPFTVQYGIQLYDSKYRYLISPKLSQAEAPFLNTGKRNLSIKEGMAAIRLPYSGQYGFTTTASFRRLNHGVVQADEALGCMDCHGASSMFNWQNLGYEKDPWASDSKQLKAPAVSKDIPTIELPPIQESVLPLPQTNTPF